MITVDINVGSITTKAVLINGDGWQSRLLPTGCSPHGARATVGRVRSGLRSWPGVDVNSNV